MPHRNDQADWKGPAANEINPKNEMSAFMKTKIVFYL